MMSPNQPDSRAVGESMQMLADETRVRIIEALAEAGEHVGIHGLTYAELMDAAGVADNGRFNYHLGKLVGRFIIKEEGQYFLRYSAHHVYRTIVSGAFAERTGIDRYDIDATCEYCDGRLESCYTENQIFYVRCFDCEATLQAAYFPARGIEDWSRADLPEVADRHLRHSTVLMNRRICPWCGMQMRVEMVRESERFDLGGNLPDSPDLYVTHVCEDCGGYQYNTVGMVLIDRTPVVSFFDDHGIDVTDVRTWDLPFAVTGRHTEVVSEEPFRAAVTITLDDERLRVTVDGNAETVEAERSMG